jgi:hypothetical protein
MNSIPRRSSGVGTGLDAVEMGVEPSAADELIG